MAELTLRNITKSFGSTPVLRGVSVVVPDGEFLSLVGQSGCGKSTLLRIIAGLETPDSGDVLIDGRSALGSAPKNRGIAMVFQDYALYPHMTVAQNLAMPLLMARLPMHARLPLLRHIMPAHRRARPAITAKVETVARQLRIDHLLERRPAQLSGGQRQRVALGRALVRDPGLFLMDEPLSNLDAKLRVEVRREITDLHRSSGLTFIYVTHDQVEAMTMSDRVALMQGGQVLQVGAPNTLYADPDTVDVARFIGSPEINLLPGRVDGGVLRVAETAWPVAIPRDAVDPIQIGVRPEAVHLTRMRGLASGRGEAEGDLPLALVTQRVEDVGPELVIHAALAGDPRTALRIRAQKTAGFASDHPIFTADTVTAAVHARDLLFFDGAGQRLRGPVEARAETRLRALS